MSNENEEEKFFPSYQTEAERKSRTHTHASASPMFDMEERKRMTESSPSILGMTPLSLNF